MRKLANGRLIPAVNISDLIGSLVANSFLCETRI